MPSTRLPALFLALLLLLAACAQDQPTATFAPTPTTTSTTSSDCYRRARANANRVSDAGADYHCDARANPRAVPHSNRGPAVGRRIQSNTGTG